MIFIYSMSMCRAESGGTRLNTDLFAYTFVQYVVLYVCVSVGLDTARPLIHEHCKKLLVNLLLLYVTHGDHFTVAKLAISSTGHNEPSCLNIQTGEW